MHSETKTLAVDLSVLDIGCQDDCNQTWPRCQGGSEACCYGDMTHSVVAVVVVVVVVVVAAAGACCGVCFGGGGVGAPLILHFHHQGESRAVASGQFRSRGGASRCCHGC